MRHAAAHPTRSIGFLSRLHDGELTEAERREFEIHTAECPECSSAAEEFEAVLAVYRQAQGEPADPALAARIARRLDARLRWRPPVRYVRLEVDLLWASVVVTCLVGVLALYSYRSTRRPPAPVSMIAETNATETPSGPPREESTVSKRDDSRSRRPVQAPAPRGSVGGFAPEERSPAAPAVEEVPVHAEEAPNPSGAPAPNRPAAESVPAPAAPLAAPDAATIPPVLIRRVEPVLPEANRRVLQAEGPFTAEAVITENGDVASIRISPPPPPALEGPIVAALREWKYRPAQRDGRPVSARLSVVIYVNRK